MAKYPIKDSKTNQPLTPVDKKEVEPQPPINQTILRLCKEQLLALMQEDLADKVVQEKIRSVSTVMRAVSPSASMQAENLSLDSRQAALLEKVLFG